MVEIDTWVEGYKVRAVDWVDGKSIYLNIAYYRPGSSLSKPPAVERTFLIPLEEEHWLRIHLHSIVTGLMATPA